MELILVRHGQPAWVTEEGTGRNDPGLTDLGRLQAERAATRLADVHDEPARGGVDRLYVSPALRAQQTAEPIADALDLAATTLDWMIELQPPPEWEGVPIEVIQEAYAGVQARGRAGWWDGIPGGESPRDFDARVRGGIVDLLRSFGMQPSETEPGLWEEPVDAPARVVLVAHGGTNSTIIAELLGVAAEPWGEWERFAMSHASFAVLATTPVYGAQLFSLRTLSDATHLDVDDRTT